MGRLKRIIDYWNVISILVIIIDHIYRLMKMD